MQLRAPGELWIDVEEFERLSTVRRDGRPPDYEQALEIYGGDLLAEDPTPTGARGNGTSCAPFGNSR